MRMSSAAELHSQIASIVEVLANSAVAEICKVVEDGYAVVNLEMSRSLKENECLRRRVRLLELQVSRYRAEQRLKSPQEGAATGRAFPGVRLLHRTGRDTPTGTASILQNRSRFLNKFSASSQPLQKTTPTDLDQDPDQEVVTTTKTEPTETEEDSDLVIVKVEGSVSIAEPNIPNNSTATNNNTPTDPTGRASDLQTQNSVQKEEPETREKSTSFWKSEEKEEGDFQTSPNNEEQSLFAPDWKHHNFKQEQSSNSAYPLSDFQNKPNSNSLHAADNTFTSGSNEVFASSSFFGQENFTPANLSVENARNDYDGGQIAGLQDPTSMHGLTNQPMQEVIVKIPNKFANSHYTCILCHQQFSHKMQLRCHERSHKAEQPYACNQCGRVFHIFGHLKRHKQVHTGERPYMCTMCSKCFSTANNLKVHQSVHTGERKFKCGTCGKSYPFHSSLIRHQAIHKKTR